MSLTATLSLFVSISIRWRGLLEFGSSKSGHSLGDVEADFEDACFD